MKFDVINDVKLFPTVSQILMLSNQKSCCKTKCIRIDFIVTSFGATKNSMDQ